MRVDKINSNNNQVNFGYSNILKTLFKEGEMPSVTHGIYGHPIDNSNVTLEHLKPHSKGGRTVLSNLALADKDANQLRSNKPLRNFLTGEMLDGYLAQFNFKIGDKFNGFQYQEMIRRTCGSQGVRSTSGIERVPGIVMAGSDSFIKQIDDEIDYGSMKSIIEHLDDVDINRIPRKILRCLRYCGLVK